MKGLLKFITCGSVDDGKSTLIGHILYDSKLLYADQERALELDSKAGSRGGKIDYSLLLDGLMEEREQGITIDVAYRYFTTNERSFIVADTPGHEEYTRNMAVGASFADLAVILVDASQGVLIQTRRHARICALMGIRYFVFAVNKMDLIDYDEDKFRAIEEQIHALARELGITEENSRFPASTGDAVVDSTASGGAAADSTASDQAVSGSVPADNTASDQEVSGSAPADSTASDQAASGSAAADNTASDQEVSGGAPADSTASDQAVSGSAPADSTASSRIVIIPVSATEGDNVTKRSEHMPWYTGPVLLSHLETIDIEDAAAESGFYMPVQRVCRPDHTFRGFQGQIESGTLHIGDEVESLPSGERAHVKSILAGDRGVESAFAGQPVTIQLDREVDVSRGCVLAAAAGAKVISSLGATLLWMDEEPLTNGKNFFVKVGTSLIPGEVTEIESVIDVNSGEVRNFAPASAGAADESSASMVSATTGTADRLSSNDASESDEPADESSASVVTATTGTADRLSSNDASESGEPADESFASEIPGSTSASDPSRAAETAHSSSVNVVSTFNADSTDNMATTAAPAVTSKPPKGFRLHKNEIAHCRITLSDRIVADTFTNHRALGELILIDRVSFHTAACGVIETVAESSSESRIGDKTVNEYLRISLKSQNPVTALFVKGRDPISFEQVKAVEKHLAHQGRHTYLYRPAPGEDFLTVVRHLTRAGIITLLVLSEEQAAGIEPEELGWLSGWDGSTAATGNNTKNGSRISADISGGTTDGISGEIFGGTTGGISGVVSGGTTGGISDGTSTTPANKNTQTSPLDPEEIAAVIRRKSSYISFEAFDRDYI